MSQFLLDSGMHLIRSSRLMHIQVPQVVMNLIFPYCGRSFTPLVLIYSRDVRERLSVKTEAKKLLNTSAFPLSVDNRSPFLFIGGKYFLSSSFSG